jgi:AcrR family transcriptional regulator
VDRLTVEGVAARSGVAKTTIYRRWRSKEDLALAVLLDMTEQVVDVPELDDTRAELVAFLARAV